MEFASLCFSLTDRCSATCKMCCFECSPHNNHVLDKNLMQDYICQAKQLGGFETIAFSGGEAMMQYDLLKEMVRYATENDFRTTLVTNGYWAGNYEIGYKKMKELYDCGLRNISISLDDWHQEYVPVETVKNALRICNDLGILSVVTLMDSTNAESVYHTIESFREEIYGKSLIVYPLLPAGKARKYFSDDQMIRLYKPKDLRCPFEKTLTVLFDGTMMMCCSQFSKDIPATHLGIFGENSIEEAMSSFRKNNFIYVLLSQGFSWFTELAGQMGFPLKDKYTSACEICYELFTNSQYMEKAVPFVKEKADGIRLDKLFQN